MSAMVAFFDPNQGEHLGTHLCSSTHMGVHMSALMGAHLYSSTHMGAHIGAPMGAHGLLEPTSSN